MSFSHPLVKIGTIAVAIGLGAVLIQSLTKSDPKPFLGTWEGTMGGMKSVTTFASDGTYRTDATIPPYGRVQTEGKYTVQGDQITMSATRTTGTDVPEPVLAGLRTQLAQPHTMTFRPVADGRIEFAMNGLKAEFTRRP